MKKGIMGLVAWVLLLFLLAAGCTNQPSKGQDKIVIGLSAPMTGDWAEYGKGFQQAAELALEEINAKGGVLGKQVQLKVGDSKGDPKEAASVAQQFAGDNSVLAVIGDFSSSCSLAALPIYDRAGVVLFSPTSSHPDLIKNSKWFFRNINSNKTEAYRLAEWAAKDFGKKAAIFCTNNDWGNNIADFFEQRIKELGGEIVDREAYMADVKDFRSMITKTKTRQPEVVFLASMYTDAALLLQQAKELQFAPAWIGSVSLQDEALLKIGGEVVNGLYLGSEFFLEDPRPEVQSFIQVYKTKYGAAPGMYPALAYDAAKIICDAIERAGSVDRAALRDALVNTKNFPGITGKTTFGADRDPIKDLLKLQVKDGKFTLYEKKQ